jgi:thiol-disulfide isomerase/thioredoxin
VVVPETFSPVVLDREPFLGSPDSRPAPAHPSPARRQADRPHEEAFRAEQISASTGAFADRTPTVASVSTLTPASALAPAPTEPSGPAPAPMPAVVEPTGPASSAASAVVAARRRPTWGEITAPETNLPPLEGSKAAPAPAVARAPACDATKPLCEYDDRRRRILDFRLPGLDGKPVRFQDLDADLVLLDFWGTWCQPCLRSVPHLVDLQARAGGKRLAVVGIACEQDAPEQAARRVAATAEKLKINYTVLLSQNDGSCPLQEALHIQAFPTMVLVDRQGRVLWRDQGATPATLARLDRMIDASPGDGATRRY